MKVICTLPNASEEINGVKFQQHPDDSSVMVSEDISDEQAAHFLSIKGYEPVGLSEKDQKTALLKRAQELNLPVSARWGLDKLAETIAAAEAAGGQQTKASEPAAGGDGAAAGGNAGAGGEEKPQGDAAGAAAGGAGAGSETEF